MRRNHADMTFSGETGVKIDPPVQETRLDPNQEDPTLQVARPVGPPTIEQPVL